LRVLYFSRDYTPHDYRFLSALGGTEHRVFYLRLEQRGHALEDRSLPPQVEHVVWEGGREPARFWDGPRLLAGLKRVIDHLKPDLILAGPLQRPAFLAALAGFKPLVSISWGYDLLFDASKNSCWSWMTRFTLKRSAVMVGDCETIRDLAISYGMPGERIVTFPWGVDLAHFSPANDLTGSSHTHTPDRQPFTLLCTRSWEPIYGVDVIARAFVIAAQQNPGLRLVMLGNGSQAALLRQVFLSGGVDEQVVFPGHVSYADLPEFYRSADLYISASHSDGTSISLLEALACGKPALVSDIPGNREWIEPGVNGWWFTDHDAGELAQLILEAYKTAQDRSSWHAMSMAARRTAEQRGDWTRNFQKLLVAFDLATGAE
jgi:glycosyltransferase involved in cell wall biosynthesis